jgi:hypothetical protein
MERCKKSVIPTLNHPSDNIKIRVTETQNTETLSKGIEAPLEASSTDQPPAEDMTHLPKEYANFTLIFAKPVAGQLPPH